VRRLRLDPRAARASVNGEPLRLTSLEYRLLHYMMMHQGRVISRTELVEHLYDQDFDRDSATPSRSSSAVCARRSVRTGSRPSAAWAIG
jgi:DNA-binding response OmpR family regulator